MNRHGIAHAAWIAALALLVVPAVASAADTFADASRLDNTGDCLTPATACKTISGLDGAVVKAGASGTVHVEPGTYPENVFLPGGISLVAVSGNPTIAPSTGIAVSVTGGPAATIDGLTLSSNVANQSELRLEDGAGSMIVSNNTFVDPTPTAGDHQVGIRTTAQGAPQFTDNTFTGLWHGMEVLSPASGVPGVPLISGNTISGTHDIGDGIQIVGTELHAVTGPTTATLVGNLFHDPGADQSDGVFVLDGGSFAEDAAAPTTGVVMKRNRIIGGTNGLEDAGARGPVTLNGDVIARTGSPVTGGAAIEASAFTGASENFGGDLTVTNADIVNNANLAFEIQDNHLTIDSSIVTGPVLEGGTTTACTIAFSDGPTTTGDSCETFQTNATPSFVDSTTDDYHLTPLGNAALIDQGNPVAPPAGTTDFDGDPRAIDADAACPLEPVRDIGADEVNNGIPDCPPPVTSPPPGTSPPPVTSSAPPGPTGQRAAALRKCKKHKHSKKARKHCRKRAKRLPV